MDCTFTREERGSEVLLRLEGALTIFSMAELTEQLFAELQGTDNALVMDLSAVDEVDTAGVQLLLMLKKHARQLNKTVVYTNHNQILLRVMDLYGLVGYFADFVRLSKKERSEYKFKYGVRKH